MNFAKSCPMLTRLFAVSALGAVLAGCATTPGSAPGECMEETKSNFIIFPFSKRTYNKDCAVGKWADQFSKSADIGEQIIGQSLKEGLDPRVKAESDRAREALRGYKAGVPKIVNGRKVMVLSPIVVEKPAETASPDTLIPAPEPTSP